jgi:hypothetical protein
MSGQRALQKVVYAHIAACDILAMPVESSVRKLLEETRRLDATLTATPI